jgi:hypothetical protein
MVYALSWMAGVLRAAGCKVIECQGWETRGHGDFGSPKGVLIHHTAGSATGNMPSLKTLINGRLDLLGPLCNLGLARDGTFYCVAAGLAWHAGAGIWRGVGQYHDTATGALFGTMSGNAHFIGIECENTGTADDHYPSVQMDALRKGCSALIAHIGADVMMVAGHREFAYPKGRKIDPLFDVALFRNSLVA